MNKLESLMGKEFKHPRRKCQICGYSVSYSNFKRHLRLVEHDMSQFPHPPPPHTYS